MERRQVHYSESWNFPIVLTACERDILGLLLTLTPSGSKPGSLGVFFILHPVLFCCLTKSTKLRLNFHAALFAFPIS